MNRREFIRSAAGMGLIAGISVPQAAPGGDTYTVSYIEAADESMVVRDVMRFRSADHA